MFEYLIGVDGGGTGTRVRIERAADGIELARGSAGPSGLLHGAGKAWAAVQAGIDGAFAEAGVARPPLARLAIGLGMAGVHNKQWAAEFTAQNPGFGAIKVETDAFCTLLGAHRGACGAIIALGTGSVGEALLADGTRREVGGWGCTRSIMCKKYSMAAVRRANLRAQSWPPAAAIAMECSIGRRRPTRLRTPNLRRSSSAMPTSTTRRMR